MSAVQDYCKGGLCFFVLFLAVTPLFAQHKIITGYIRDAHSDERIPFASVQFKKSGEGKLSDSSGTFTFHLTGWPSDTLVVTYVGYQDVNIFINRNVVGLKSHDTLFLVVNMERGRVAAEIIVRGKVDRGLLLWRKIVRQKPLNDRFRFENFSYELYNKLEVEREIFSKKQNNNNYDVLCYTKCFEHENT